MQLLISTSCSAVRLRGNSLHRSICLRHFSAPKDVQMPTPRSLGFSLQYRENLAVQDHDKRTLVVVCGWMGAKESQLKSYIQFYHQQGFDTLSFACGPHHVLLPSQAMKVMEKVAEESMKSEAKRLVFHHFSMGGYLYGQLLRHLKIKGTRDEFVPLVKAQIFDSPPDFSGIAKGISQSMGVGPPLSTVAEYAMRLYLFVTSTTAGVEHRASSAHFHDNYIQAPSLWFYSKADPVARYQDCEIVWGKWKAKGTTIKTVVWEDTPHIQHARIDPERYFGSLKQFLVDHEVIERQRETEGERLEVIENKQRATVSS
jgi:hypothetical protein